MPIKLIPAAIVALLAVTGSVTSAQTLKSSATTQPGAQDGTSATPPASEAPAQSAAAAPLVIYFDIGSAVLPRSASVQLDNASRLYREGNPIVMIVTGSSDATGSAEQNLHLSELRANAVLQGLIARGIPAARFQVLAKGATEPAVPESPSQPEAKNRRVEIAWR